MPPVPPEAREIDRLLAMGTDDARDAAARIERRAFEASLDMNPHQNRYIHLVRGEFVKLRAHAKYRAERNAAQWAHYRRALDDMRPTRIQWARDNARAHLAALVADVRTYNLLSVAAQDWDASLSVRKMMREAAL